MIEVVVGALADQGTEGVVRPIRSDLAPVTVDAREVADRAGDELRDRLESAGAVPVGAAVITPAGDLPSDFVIHVVVMSEEEPQTTVSVQKALKNGLRRAVDLELSSLALPPLGLGVGAMEPEDTARVIVDILLNHLDEGHPPLSLRIVTPSDFEAEVFRRLVDQGAGDRAPGGN